MRQAKNDKDQQQETQKSGCERIQKPSRKSKNQSGIKLKIIKNNSGRIKMKNAKTFNDNKSNKKSQNSSEIDSYSSNSNNNSNDTNKDDSNKENDLDLKRNKSNSSSFDKVRERSRSRDCKHDED